MLATVLLDSAWNWYHPLKTADKIALWAVIVSTGSVFASVVGGFVAALVGARFGANAAYKLGHAQQIRDREDKRYSSLIATQYALFSQLNMLENIRVALLEKYRNDPQRYVKLPIYHMSDTANHISINDITFIAESKDADLLQHIHLAEQAYLAAMESLDRFREQQVKFYDNPSIEYKAFNFDTGNSKIKASQRDMFAVKETANTMYRVFDNSILRLHACIPKIGDYISEHFPRRVRLTFTSKNPELLNATTPKESVSDPKVRANESIIVTTQEQYGFYKMGYREGKPASDSDTPAI